ncbi:APC family permease [Staphylococcus carnosus]|uniref:Amino acid permease n=2 Tax=Staphylococcus carnosus TaxID=1281 RepID=A0AAJ0NI93_STACA|nr:APC family permease [Staphylococcus carnosus]KKB25601.1 amino acid permease [Staphylococcus carnosus]POA05753.1 APC family permease [Staphylococcus carnosus]QQS84113.1 APC family permease [Staphylococcus carnosus]QRQ04049.1 APC family permease [Staphylococcus carnosus]UTB83944.1 amino acid permease [Staphylococcus carnosus]
MKKLGFWSIVLFAINSIIGSGIFLSPAAVIKIAGKYTPIVYVSAALLAAVLAITFAAAAKYVSKSGAAYAYATAAFGKNIGFYVGITRFVAASIAWGVMATAVVKTVITIFGGDNTEFWMITLGLLLLMAVLLIINMAGNKIFTIINNLSTIGKLLALVTTIVAGAVIVIMTGKNHFNEINSIVDTSKINGSTLVMAVIAAFYAFTGFESVANASEDMKKPERNLPRAIPLAILVIGIVYIGIIIVTMMVNPGALIKTKEVVSLVAVFDSPVIYNIILYGALVSMFGINVAASFGTPRILEAIANENQVPHWFKQRTKQGFPFIAFLTTCIVAAVLPMAFQYDMTSIIILSSISRFIQFLVVPVGVLMFYFGKERGHVLDNVHKNIVTDVILPAVSLLLTILLLVMFDWKGQFSIKTDHGTMLNYYAITAMVIGYAILPAVLFWVNKKRKTEIKYIL